MSEILLDEATHTYRVAGEIWPAVSRIIKPLECWDGIPPDVLEAAAAFGRNVHAACHLHNIGQLGELSPALVPYVDAWKQFLADMDVTVIGSEVRVAHATLRYCGTLDVHALIRDREELIDLKSTVVMPRAVGPQTAGYANAMGKPRIRRRAVQLRDDGTYRSKILKDPTDWSIFLSCRNLYNWRNRNVE